MQERINLQMVISNYEFKLHEFNSKSISTATFEPESQQEDALYNKRTATKEMDSTIFNKLMKRLKQTSKKTTKR